jgi:hypothetical protein
MSLLICCSALLFLSQSSFGQASLTSNLRDYAPNSSALLWGSGFTPYESVNLVVVNLTHPANITDLNIPWTVSADANGKIVTTWTVCNCPGDSLQATAMGGTSALSAVAKFTDQGGGNDWATLDFQQASNVNHPTTPISWINGILNPNNSDYQEGIGVPQRIIITGLTGSASNNYKHTITLEWQAVKGGHHAYDMIMSWSQAVATAADIGNGTRNELQNLFTDACNGALSGPASAVCASLLTGP